MVGDLSGGGTPGPFSNPVVKPTRADGTGGVAPWESRSSPTHPVLFFLFQSRLLYISPCSTRASQRVFLSPAGLMYTV